SGDEPEARSVQAHPGAIVDVAVAGDLVATLGAEGAVKLWDASGASIATLPCDAAPAHLWLPPDRPLPAASRHPPPFRPLGVAARRQLPVESMAAPATAMAFGPGGLLAIGSGGRLHVLDLESRRMLRLVGHEDTVAVVAFTSDGTLISGGRDHAVRLWDARAG